MRAPGGTGSAAGVLSLLERFGPQDWLVIGYLAYATLGVLLAEPSPARSAALLKMGALFAWSALGVALVRASWVPEGWLRAIVYRVSIYGPVQLSYFFFRDVLPVVNPGSLDRELQALDVALFGVEPALALDRFVTTATTEWFSYFYFGYFFVLALHVIPILFFSRSQRILGEFALGALIVACVGQSIYMLVPGFGPYKAMESEFQNAFPGGLWYGMVMRTVESAGALKDIFPSLHTAFPMFISLFSFYNRRRLPYKYSWPLVFIYSLNIVGATLFLRWHYLVDVVAGLVLAFSAATLSPILIERDRARRARRALEPLWPEYNR
ncbi:MAG TPA: phosphatase PAP2 family protein [Polyangiaceae bacterium]|nr:phosphatase PAP2 family protein [Polyangiaceae bacterium]